MVVFGGVDIVGNIAVLGKYLAPEERCVDVLTVSEVFREFGYGPIVEMNTPRGIYIRGIEDGKNLVSRTMIEFRYNEDNRELWGKLKFSDDISNETRKRIIGRLGESL